MSAPVCPVCGAAPIRSVEHVGLTDGHLLSDGTVHDMDPVHDADTVAYQCETHGHYVDGRLVDVTSEVVVTVRAAEPPPAKPTLVCPKCGEDDDLTVLGNGVAFCFRCEHEWDINPVRRTVALAALDTRHFAFHAVADTQQAAEALMAAAWEAHAAETGAAPFAEFADGVRYHLIVPGTVLRDGTLLFPQEG